MLPTVLLVLNTLGLLALYFHFKNKYLKDFPGRSKITALEIEVSDFNGTVADLIDRFNRFQKKENMRAVRLEKAQEKDVLEQAREIAASASSHEPEGPRSDKLDLWKGSTH